MTQNPFADPNYGAEPDSSKVAPKNPFSDPNYGAPAQGGTASDLGKSLKAGVQRLPGMATGLADLPFALAAGARPFTKAADALGEATGFQPGKWADETQFSQGYEDSKKAVDAAWKDGKASDIAGAYLSNPGYTANQVVESLPSMFAGGFGAKALMGAGRVAGAAADAAAGTAARAATPGLVARAVGEKWAAPVAGGIGEGAVTAGQQMANYQGDDQQKGAVAALGAGVGTGLIGGVTGRLANKMGFDTAETALANLGSGARANAPASLKRRVLGGMVSEGVLQELPQSAQEQMWSNFAEGKPLMEGVARAGTEGALAGAVMGAGANLRGPGAQPPPTTDPEAQDTPPGTPAGSAPDAPPALGFNPSAGTTTVFPDGSTILNSESRNGEQAVFDKRYAPQPVKPSEEMGLNPAAGPLSAAAASAVDSGAYMPPADQAPPPAPEPDPVVLQNRDRTSAASIAQMQEIAANPDYLRVGPSRGMTSGAPIVFGDLPQAALLGRAETVVDGNGERLNTQYAVVDAGDLIASNNADGTTVAEYASGAPGKLRSVAGNGRTAGLQAAYQLGTTQRYRQELEADAAAIGVDAQALAAMQRPVLVRLMQGEDVTRDMGDRTNITATQKLSPLEQAGNDARRLDVRTLAFDEGGSPTADSIKGFVSAMPVSERGDMLNPDGTPTRQAVDRLMAATFKQAYESDELVQLYAQATDPDARAVMAAAADASGVLANLKGAGEFDVRAAVADAAKMAVNAARQGVKLADVLKNADIDISPEAYPVAEFLAQNIRSPKAMAEGLRRWGQLALEQARIAEENTRQGSLLGPRPTLSRAEIFARMGHEANPTGQGIAPPAKAAPTPVQADMAQQPQELPQAAQPQAATEATGRHSTWRKNAIQAGRVARELGLDPQGKRLAQIVAEIDAYDAAQNKPAAAGEKLKLNIFGLPDGIDFLPGTQAVPASSLKAGDWIVIDSAINSVKGVKPISSQRLELDLLGADGRYAIEVSPSTTVQRKLTSADGAAAPESALDGMLEGLDAIKTGMAKKVPPALELTAPTPADIKARQERAEAAAKADAAAKRAEDAAATEADNRKRIAAASVAAADSFELGQAPMDSLTGQKDVFADAPQQQAATKKEAASAQPVSNSVVNKTESTAQQAQAATETAADKPPAKRKLPAKLAAKAAEVEAQRAAYFAPGNVVASYAGHDRVVAYTPADAQGNWSVTVQAVEKQDGQWVNAPGKKEYTHSTQPDARALKAGPVVAAKANQPATPDTPAQAAIDSGADAAMPGAMFSRAQPTPQDFVPSPDGGLDYGEITPEMGKAMRRQAAPIRLRQGDGDTGLHHIQRPARLQQIKSAGYGSAADFVGDVAQNFDAVHRGRGSSLFLVKKTDRPNSTLVVQLEAGEDGDFYDVKTALVSRPDFMNGKELLWDRAQSNRSETGTPSAISGQSGISVPPKTSDAKFSRAESPMSPELARAIMATQPAPATKESVRAAVRELVGGLGLLPNRLGRVVVATAAEIRQDWEPLIGPTGMEASGGVGKAQGFYDPKSKTVFLIADHIKAGDELGVAAHELMHKHGPAVLGQENWDKLHSAIGGWAKAKAGSMERIVYDEAARRVQASGPELSTQELFPYAVQVALEMGVRPNALAPQGTVARWLGQVRAALRTAWEKITRKPDSFKSQDLVNLAFGIAQRENPAYAGGLDGAVARSDATDVAQSGGVQFSRAADIQSSMGTLTPEQRATYEKVAGFQKVPTLKERMDSLKANLGLRLKQALVDQFAPIRDVSQRAYMLARMSKAGDAVVEALLYYGKPFMRDGVMDVKIGSGGFASVLASLKGEHDRFFMWVAAQRAERIRDERAAADTAMAGLNAQMIALRRTMKTSTGKDYSDAATELRELESQHAKLDKTARELLFDEDDITSFKSLNAGKMQDGTVRLPVYAAALRELNEYNEAALQTAMESGLIDKDTLELMKSQPYVPFYRLMENEGAMGGAKLSAGLTNQKAWEKLKGSNRQLNADLLQNVMQNWSHLYAASARNRAAVSTMAAAYRMGVATRANAATKGAVKISRKGVAEYWTVEDPYLLEAISAINYQASPLMKPLAKAKSLLTFGVTISPTFKIRNLIRDSLSAISQSELGYNPLKNVKSGWKLTASDSQMYASMLASGGVIKFGSQENNDRLRAKVAKLGGVLLDQNGLQKFQGQLKDLYDVYAEFGDRTENVNRVALYDQLIKNGKSHAEASFMARDLMDFSMGGAHPLVRFLTQTVPFLNARLQGLYKLGRAANEDPRKFATMAMAVSVASVGLMALFGDDDDWKKREDWDRDAYWWFKVGETAFRIPKPFELGAIGTIAERTAEAMFSDEMTSKRFAERMSHMVAQTFALDPIPQAFKPLLDIYSNKDSFTKRAIESQADQRLRPQDRYNERTSEVARMLGSLGLPEPSQLIKGNYAALSPKQVDHLIRGYFSWLGVTAATVSDFALRPMMDRGERPDMRLRDAFIAGNFIESLPTGSSRYVSQLYEQSRSVEQAFASYREAIKTGDMDGAAQIKEANIDKLRNRVAYANATKQLSEINAQAKRIEASTKLDGEAKRERLTELELRRGQVAERLRGMGAG